MSFQVSAEAYGRFMGRFSEPLAGVFADWAGVRAGQRALDVGCGPGALTAALVQRLGAGAVLAVDPSPPFVDAVRARFADIDVRRGVAEELPFGDDSVDVALAELVVHFMSDPVRGLREMRRVTRPGGTVAGCVWDHGGGGGPLSLFWQAVHEIDPSAPGEATLAGSREGHLAELFTAAGLHEVETASLAVTVAFEHFSDWWEPFTLGVGPAGSYVAGLDDRGRDLLRSVCEELSPPAPFDVEAAAWAARGLA